MIKGKKNRIITGSLKRDPQWLLQQDWRHECYEAAFLWLMAHADDPSLRLVHGTIPARGKLFRHAWCESDEECIDLTMPNVLRRDKTHAMWRDAINVVKYTADEALRIFNDLVIAGVGIKEMERFQFFPDLTAEEFASLQASIADRGVDIPIIVDENGQIIDGFHRQRACDEIGVFCRREVRQFASESEKFELALRLNCRRRQLNRQQKRELIAAYLRRDPQISDNHLAETIGGISKNTVADIRTQLERTCQIDKFDHLRGRDGKDRPTRYKRIIASTPREAEMALAVIADLPSSCEGKTLDITTAKRRASRNRNRMERMERVVEPIDLESIKLFHCRFQDLERVAEIVPGTVDLIFTDIPYNQPFVQHGQVDDLGTVAARLLRPGGVFITYSGQYWLPQIINGLSGALTYRWTGASIWRGQANSCHAVHARSKWKPLLIFSNGSWTPPKPWVDVTEVESVEKQWHVWQQPLSEAERWIERFSHPGDLVVDTCGGGFTTAVACYRLDRRCISCDVDVECVTNGQARLSEAILDKEYKSCNGES